MKKKLKILLGVYLTGIDELDEKDRAEIITKSKFQPSEKIKRIETGFSYLKKTDKKKVKKKDNIVELHSPDEIRMEWGINIGKDFVEVEAKCLPIPELEFKDKKEIPSLRNGRFKQLADYHPIKFDQNNCMLITFKNLVDLADNDCRQMQTAGKNLGANINIQTSYINTNNKKNKIPTELKQSRLITEISNKTNKKIKTKKETKGIILKLNENEDKIHRIKNFKSKHKGILRHRRHVNNNDNNISRMNTIGEKSIIRKSTQISKMLLPKKSFANLSKKTENN